MPTEPASSAELPPSNRPLPPKQVRFVELYLIHLNATRAYREAYGAKQKVAEANGPRLLGNARVAEAIAAAQKERSARTGIAADVVFARLWEIATADPRELIEYRRTCCRYCYGVGFDYQRTHRELERDRSQWDATQTKKSTAVFNEQGGDGYVATRVPNPICPECFGEGVERVFVHDTRKIPMSALCLYAGVKQTKDGIEVKMHDQQAALLAAGKHLGMFVEKEPPAADSNELARQIRDAVRAMRDADGLNAAA